MNNKLELLNQIVVERSYLLGPSLRYVIVANATSTIDILLQLGVTHTDLEIAEAGARAWQYPNALDLSTIAMQYTDAKWFDQSSNQFVSYGYAERFLAYRPFEHLVSAEELSSLPVDTQQLVSLMTSYRALIHFIQDEYQLCEETKHDEHPHRNSVLTNPEMMAIIHRHTHSMDACLLPIRAYLQRDRKQQKVSAEDSMRIQTVLHSYLRLYPVLLHPDMDHSPVFSHLYRRDEVVQFLNKWKAGHCVV